MLSLEWNLIFDLFNLFDLFDLFDIFDFCEIINRLMIYICFIWDFCEGRKENTAPQIPKNIVKRIPSRKAETYKIELKLEFGYNDIIKNVR